MSRAQFTLWSRSERERAMRWVDQAPSGTIVTFKESKRSTDQNAKLWASLTDIATQLPWHGIRLSPDDWKLIFLDALNREMRLVPNIDGNGFVNLGRSSSNLTKAEFAQLLELILAFGANHDIVFHDQRVPEVA
jgi:hypothetical protein